MSVASEITRLQGIKSDIRTALVAKGITSASTHDMADFAGDIGDIQTGGGGGIEGFEKKLQATATSTTETVTGLEVGKKYIFAVIMYYQSVADYNRFDNTTFTNSTYQKICNLFATNATGAGTLFEVTPTSTSVAMTAPYPCRLLVIGTT